MDLDSIEHRSKTRLLKRIPEDSPVRKGSEIMCPFCGYDDPLSVRFSKLGRLRRVDDTQPHIEGIKLKHAGDGCAVIAKFDVPLVEGFWPSLTDEEEWKLELELRGGERAVDFGYDVPKGKSVEKRLTELGYLENQEHE